MSVHDLHKVRNIGIAAHIDAGKTTLAERVLFYTGRIRRVHEVRGADGVGATMDSTSQERDRGISIQAAATTCVWHGHPINLIDTPGHMDFTVEVERSMRVLDGAVLLLCAVAGVQAQTVGVCRQMDRYGLPRIAFVNKCDRPGADPAAAIAQLRERLGTPAVLIQLPLFEDGGLSGAIDLVAMRALRFAGPRGERVVEGPIPESMADATAAARTALLDAASLHSDPLTEALLGEAPVTPALIHAAIRAGVLARGLVPALVGSAYRDRGVQPLLDAVARYLPSPEDAAISATDTSGGERDGEPVALRADRSAELAALAFKVQETRHGSLVWLRLYQGALTSGQRIYDVGAGRWLRVGRMGRLHAGALERIESAGAGDIVALFGAPCASGTTLTGGARWALAPMVVPEPVLEATARLERGDPDRLTAALGRLTREDPTLRVHTDRESGELRLRGMGELHLDVVVRRLLDDHKLRVSLGAPRVALRQAIRRRAEFDHLHRKQRGGRGQYARVTGWIEPWDEGDFAFDWRVVGGAIPGVYRGPIERGFREALADRDPPAVGARVVIVDGAVHSEDSSEHAFYACARAALRGCFDAADPVILEPLMRVEAEADPANNGALLRTLLARRGRVLASSVDAGAARVEAEVPLANLFNYAGALRAATSGSGAFTMSFSRYAPR